MKKVSVLVSALILTGCSTLSFDWFCSGCDEVVCAVPEPLELPAVDDDGYARFDEQDREQLIQYFLKAESCFDQIE